MPSLAEGVRNENNDDGDRMKKKETGEVASITPERDIDDNNDDDEYEDEDMDIDTDDVDAWSIFQEFWKQLKPQNGTTIDSLRICV